jgi:hypothetical protein
MVISRPTLDEAFPILSRIELVPLERCKAAYDRYDARSRGYAMDRAHYFAAELRSTRKIIEHLWPGMDPEKYGASFEDLALTFEYAVRLAALE